MQRLLLESTAAFVLRVVFFFWLSGKIFLKCKIKRDVKVGCDYWMEADCCLCFRTRWLQLADRHSNRVGQSAAQNHSHMSLSSPAPTVLHAQLGSTRLGSDRPDSAYTAEVISTDDFRESEHDITLRWTGPPCIVQVYFKILHFRFDLKVCKV